MKLKEAEMKLEIAQPGCILLFIAIPPSLPFSFSFSPVPLSILYFHFTFMAILDYNTSHAIFH